MAQTVGQHGLAAFVNPSNGDALDATVVKGNDNTMRNAYVDHDNDPGIHLQSSTLASRPAAGEPGRKWLTTDTGSIKLWFDNGSTWEEITYLTSSSNLNASNLASGTVPDARFPATLPAASGTNLTNLNATNLSSGTVPDARFPATLPALSGVNLTSLNASNLGSGTIPDARFPSALPSLTALTVVGTTKIQQVLETATVSATAATGTINYDILTQAVLYYTADATANWTINFRGNSGTTLDSVMVTGQTATVAFLVKQGSSAYSATAHQVDGSSVTVKWPGGIAPTSTNTNGVDIYSYTLVKTGSATFTVFSSLVQFS